MKNHWGLELVLLGGDQGHVEVAKVLGLGSLFASSLVEALAHFASVIDSSNLRPDDCQSRFRLGSPGRCLTVKIVLAGAVAFPEGNFGRANNDIV